ncbi:MAG: CRISPR-associated helicase Cas3', partial [Firmicutes bacterium]|nr:CRISPR-associated helicase Cas3' [Bacillota bacterium]
QAYDPKIAALIVRALEMIDAIGGKFMIMTATLPKIYFDRIMNSKEIQRFPLVYKTFVNDDLKRHRLKMINTSILDYIKEIALAGKQKKTLVICNTVKQAINVYERLLQEKADVNLLHSLFLQKDRFLLEKKIKEFAKNCSYGIWVTTQLVEASLDIDFDILYTELSTLDSFFQRLGRCYRQRNLEHNKPNIWVFTEDISGVPYVYDKDLVYKSVILLQNYNEKLLLESEKIKLIEVLYSNESLRGMNFFKTFNETLSYLENIEPYDIDKQEAQKYLRDINNVKVIPRNVFDQISDDLIARYRKEKDRVKRRRLRREIDQYTISINKYRARNFLSKSGLPASLADLFIMDLYYDFYKGRGVGLNLSKSEGLENFMS